MNNYRKLKEKREVIINNLSSGKSYGDYKSNLEILEYIKEVDSFLHYTSDLITTLKKDRDLLESKSKLFFNSWKREIDISLDRLAIISDLTIDLGKLDRVDLAKISKAVDLAEDSLKRTPKNRADKYNLLKKLFKKLKK